MYKLIINDWNLALHDFTSYLLKGLGDNLKMIIGLSEDTSVYDSNVLVVVREINDEVRRIVANAAIKTNEKHKCIISYYLTDNKGLVDEFKQVGGKEVLKMQR
ncbi:hypothetical protein [Sulfurisphaera ohwakuensis]|uniref:hypothetical protein n=1 Tax=Sulfurisphaera ohwakuensis TaxID=69656 RepID=UPI0036F2437E